MFCEKCGTQVQEGAAFCPNCGECLGVDPANRAENVGENTKQSKKRKKRIVPIICFLLVVIIGIGVFGLIYFNNKPEFYLSRKTEFQNTSFLSFDEERNENEYQITDTWYLEDGQISKTVVRESDFDLTTIFSFNENNHVSGIEITYDNEIYNFEFHYSEQNNQYVGDSNTVNIDDNYISYRFVYDDQNRRVSKIIYNKGYEILADNTTYFNNGKVKSYETKKGVVWWDNTVSYPSWFLTEFDEYGNTVHYTTYTNEGDILYEILYEYDNGILKSGSRIYGENLDEKGYVSGMNSYFTLENRDGNCYEYYTRDENGDVVGMSKDTYDDNNNLIKEESFTADKELSSYTEYTYDDNDNLIKIEYFTADKGVYSYMEYSYDEYGNCVEQSQYEDGYLRYQTKSVYTEK